jgi:hypothetical protein
MIDAIIDDIDYELVSYIYFDLGILAFVLILGLLGAIVRTGWNDFAKWYRDTIEVDEDTLPCTLSQQQMIVVILNGRRIDLADFLIMANKKFRKIRYDKVELSEEERTKLIHNLEDLTQKEATTFIKSYGLTTTVQYGVSR